MDLTIAKALRKAHRPDARPTGSSRAIDGMREQLVARLWSAEGRAAASAQLDMLVADRFLDRLAELPAGPGEQPDRKRLTIAFGSRFSEQLAADYEAALRLDDAFDPALASLPDDGGDEGADDLLYDPDVPVFVSRAVIAWQRGMLASIALARLDVPGTRPRESLARYLVEVFREGAYAMLRFLASLHGPAVPLELVPLAERVDLDALERENDATWAALLATAETER